jgi:hypothetical protein
MKCRVCQYLCFIFEISERIQIKFGTRSLHYISLIGESVIQSVSRLASRPDSPPNGRHYISAHKVS